MVALFFLLFIVCLLRNYDVEEEVGRVGGGGYSGSPANCFEPC